MPIKILIAVNKKDLWFCRICVASVRYFYPDIEIFLFKDEINGQFSTLEIEENWNVSLYRSNISSFGYGASKTFFLLDMFKDDEYLILDSDIIFVSPFIESITKEYFCENDLVINADVENPEEDWIKNVYFNIEEVKKYDSSYEYPGYFFNTGQVFIRGGKIKDSDLEYCFNRTYPYWMNYELFPLVDQSVYNYVFPKMEKQGNLKIGKAKFMHWSESSFVDKLNIQDIIGKNLNCGLIHWAGVFRHPVLKGMTRSDLLRYFENYYYSKISFSKFKQKSRLVKFLLHSFQERFKRKLLNLNFKYFGK
jgi:hypothetical protein